MSTSEEVSLELLLLDGSNYASWSSEVKCLQHNAQATNVLFSALSEDVFDAIIFVDDEPLDDAHIIWTTLRKI